MSGLVEQHPTPLVILLQVQLKVSQLVNGVEYFVSATEVTLQNYQALQGMLFGIKKKWGGCCGELALPKTCWRHAVLHLRLTHAVLGAVLLAWRRTGCCFLLGRRSPSLGTALLV